MVIENEIEKELRRELLWYQTKDKLIYAAVKSKGVDNCKCDRLQTLYKKVIAYCTEKNLKSWKEKFKKVNNMTIHEKKMTERINYESTI